MIWGILEDPVDLVEGKNHPVSSADTPPEEGNLLEAEIATFPEEGNLLAAEIATFPEEGNINPNLCPRLEGGCRFNKEGTLRAECEECKQRVVEVEKTKRIAQYRRQQAEEYAQEQARERARKKNCGKLECCVHGRTNRNRQIREDKQNQVAPPHWSDVIRDS